jgi:hypothetical protein
VSRHGAAADRFHLEQASCLPIPPNSPVTCVLRHRRFVRCCAELIAPSIAGDLARALRELRISVTG